MAHVASLLREKRHLLDQIATALLEKEVIEGDDFEQMVRSDAQSAVVPAA